MSDDYVDIPTLSLIMKITIERDSLGKISVYASSSNDWIDDWAAVKQLLNDALLICDSQLQ